MKLEVGMYIRFNGFISKIEHIRISLQGEQYAQFREPSSLLSSCNSRYIEKASNNIIDLIEVGDYVNGYKVRDVGVEELGHTYLSLDMNEDIHWLESEIENEKDIKSIVTKEQFESMSYKVD